jgi:transcriptional regulator with XRE-family HTH domain
MDINAHLARRIRELREACEYSQDELAARSGVSRSNISLIERNESSPTATVLDKLSVGLGVTLASLFEASTAQATEPSPLSRFEEQPQWTDPSSGYVRRNLSPTLPSPLQMVEVVFPPKKKVSYDTAARDEEIHQQIWVIKGTMDVTVGEQRWRLEAGDCLAMRLDQPITYRNPTTEPARYLVALVQPTTPRRRSA